MAQVKMYGVLISMFCSQLQYLTVVGEVAFIHISSY